MDVWDVELWMDMPDNPAEAVKLMVRLTEEPTATKLYELRCEVVTTFRRVYGHWARHGGQRVAKRTI